MKIKASYKTITAFLILVFGTFNVGIPIVKYLCPLMNSEKPVCEMISEHSDSPAIAHEKPSCCTSYIVAERNTTPYLSVEKFKAPSNELVSHYISSDFIAFQSFSTNQIVPANTSPPPAEDIPLFVLNSTLLI